jgi:hypothetical protein
MFPLWLTGRAALGGLSAPAAKAATATIPRRHHRRHLLRGPPIAKAGRILRELAPKATALGFLVNPSNPRMKADVGECAGSCAVSWRRCAEGAARRGGWHELAHCEPQSAWAAGLRHRAPADRGLASRTSATHLMKVFTSVLLAKDSLIPSPPKTKVWCLRRRPGAVLQMGVQTRRFENMLCSHRELRARRCLLRRDACWL